MFGLDEQPATFKSPDLRLLILGYDIYFYSNMIFIELTYSLTPLGLSTCEIYELANNLTLYATPYVLMRH